MAGNGSVNNMMRLAYLGKSKGQPFTLSSERLLFHVLYSVINQPNKCSKNLEMCKNCVNTHTHTHSHRLSAHALIYSFHLVIDSTGRRIFFSVHLPVSAATVPYPAVLSGRKGGFVLSFAGKQKNHCAVFRRRFFSAAIRRMPGLLMTNISTIIVHNGKSKRKAVQKTNIN